MHILIHRITPIKKEREGITIKWPSVEQVVQQVFSQLAEAIQHRCHITGISQVFIYLTKSQTISFQIHIIKKRRWNSARGPIKWDKTRSDGTIKLKLPEILF